LFLFCAAADDTIRELRKHGAYKDLYDAVVTPPVTPRWPEGKPEA
jgi:hypothetical protein